MSVSFPMCPVCHKPYSSTVTPMLMQPCCHGICKDCITTFVEDHEGRTCPTCRVDITDVTPNYDLRDMCQNQDQPEWSYRLTRVIPAGSNIEFNENVECMASLIYLRLRIKYLSLDSLTSMTDIKNCLTHLILKKPYDYLLQWILALNFEEKMEMTLIDHLNKQKENLNFLEKEGATWLMPLLEM